MSTEAYTVALKNALTEIKNVCPEISHAFVFKENGENLAEDENKNELTISSAQEAFMALAKKGETLGGIESVTFKGSQGRVNFSKFNNFYVANVSSNDADQKTVTNLTRVMIPTMLKLVRQEVSFSQEHLREPEIKAKFDEIPIVEPSQIEIRQSEFTVENAGFGGFLGDPEAALVDTMQIAQWAEIFGDKHITKIKVNNLRTGKSINCTFKPIKESKFESKGIIQIPEENPT